jgi:predicted glycosyltransferase
MRIGLHTYGLRGLGDMAQMIRLSRALAHHDVVWLGHKPDGGVGRVWLGTPVFLATYRHGGFSAEANRELAFRGEEMVRRLQDEPLDLLIINYFPFGRLDFLPELLPVLQACQRLGIPIVGSMRDISGKAPWPADQQAQALELINAYFNLIVWHGDERFLPLDFDLKARITVPVVPTGYMTDPPPAPCPEAKHVVATFGSGGGGGVYAALVMLAAFRRLIPAGWTMTLVTGHRPWERISRSVEGGDWSGLRLRRWEPDLPGLLATAQVCVTQCGYGSFSQIARSGRPTLLVPWERPREKEQIVRAQALCRYPGYRMLSFVADDLADRIAAVIPELADCPVVAPDLNWDGVAGTLRALETSLGMSLAAPAAHH